MKKTPIYFMPGLAARPAIFKNLALDATKYSFHYLEWVKPLSIEETIENYAHRLSLNIKEKNTVLIGVSFGGIMMQELAKFVAPKKVIIISSIKSSNEFPKKFKLAKFTKVYKIFPINLLQNFEDYSSFFLGERLKKKVALYKKQLPVRNNIYLKWAISNSIEWVQIKPPENITHIHGTKDIVFPIKNIKNSIEIKDGTHVMILTKAKKISKIIDAILTC